VGARKGSGEMNAISLWNPWALFVKLNEKKNETRSWYTSYRGLLAIHAAKTFPKEAKELCWTEPFRSILLKHGYDLSFSNMPFGCIVATVNLVDCCKVRCVRPVKIDGIIVRTAFLESKNRLIEVSGQELIFGNYDPGRYIWLFEDIKPLPEPIPAKGKQGLWNWTEGAA
jgi:hypothetical protein